MTDKEEIKILIDRCNKHSYLLGHVIGTLNAIYKEVKLYPEARYTVQFLMLFLEEELEKLYYRNNEK